MPGIVLDTKDTEVNKNLHSSGGRQMLYKQRGKYLQSSQTGSSRRTGNSQMSQGVTGNGGSIGGWSGTTSPRR